MEKTITFFPDFYESIKFLPDELFGAVIRAAMEYQLTGEEYSGDNQSVKMAFNFAKGQTDRKREYSEKKRSAANNRWSKESSDSESRNDAHDSYPVSKQCTLMQNDAEECTDMQRDAPSPYPSPCPSPDDNESKAPAKAKKPPKKSFGQYGWVKLTDAEYTAIVNDLGMAEAERCISYIDECAQSTENKNRWRDWNLVVRKCSRDGWGKQKQSGRFTQTQRPGDIHGCSELGQAEIEAIQQTLRRTLDNFDVPDMEVQRTG